MASKLSDCWQTPQWLFDELNKEFNFTHDLCADETNHLCENWFEDYLKSEFKKGVGFCNMPYSNPKPFIEKAWEDSKHCKIVCLVKCDPSTRWWSTFWNYKDIYIEKVCWVCDGDGKAKLSTGKQLRYCFLCESVGYYSVLCGEKGPKLGCEVRFFPKRIKFDPPKGFVGKATSSAFPCALIIMDRRGI